MLVLLPPSEGKTAPTSGPPLDLAGLSLPALTRQRRAVLDTVARTSSRPDALEVLKSPAGAFAEVVAQRHLHDLPTERADRVFTGVLFERVGFDDLTEAARERAERTITIMSGAFGALGVADRIPAHRLGMAASMPGIGPLPAYWRGPLTEALGPRADGSLVVDCRSGVYRSMWKVPAGADLVEIGAVTVHGGARRVVSHDAKYFRGLLVGHLLRRRGREPGGAAALRDAAGELVGTVREAAAPPRKGAERTTWTLTDVELAPPVRAGAASTLTMVLTQRP